MSCLLLCSTVDLATVVVIKATLKIPMMTLRNTCTLFPVGSSPADLSKQQLMSRQTCSKRRHHCWSTPGAVQTVAVDTAH